MTHLADLHDAAGPGELAETPPEDTGALHALLRERLGEIAILTRALIRTQDTLAAAQKDIVELRGAITQAETRGLDETREAQEALAAAQAETERMRAELVEAEARWQDSEHGAQTAIAAARDEIDRVVGEFRRSSSWRVTAPLRAVSRLVSRRG